MPESNTDPSASASEGQPTGGPAESDDKFQAVTSQDDLDRIVGERVKRERAKFADYDAIKAKAAKFDAAEAANKSDLEKAEEARVAAEKARDDAIAEGLRFRIAARHGISDEDAELFLTGRDEQTLEAQAKRLADREADRKKNGTRSPNEGRSPKSGTDDVREFTRALFKTGT